MNYQDKFDQMMGHPMQELDRILPKAEDVVINTDSIAEGIIRHQEAFRAKNHKPSPMSDKAAEWVASAQECEKRRIIEARIRKHTEDNIIDIFGEGK